MTLNRFHYSCFPQASAIECSNAHELNCSTWWCFYQTNKQTKGWNESIASPLVKYFKRIGASSITETLPLPSNFRSLVTI